MLRDMTKTLPQGPWDLPSGWESEPVGGSVRFLRLRLQKALGGAGARAVSATPASVLMLDERDWAGAPLGRRQVIGFC